MEGVPVNIVKTKSDGKLVLSEEELRKIVCSDGVKDLEVVVVAIAGAYRTGKSFLMNLLAGYLQLYQEGEVVDTEKWLQSISQGFDCRPGIDTVTKGIWIWSKPFIIKSQDKEVCVLLLDTEGEDDVGTSQKQDMRIYALTAMMSSMLIYNVMHQIGAGDNQLLQVYSSLEPLWKSNTIWQRLCILIRDWRWGLDEDEPEKQGHLYYGINGGEEYKKQKILHQGPNHDKHLLSLDQAYEQVDCFLMQNPSPTIDSSSLNGKNFSYRPQFKKQVKSFAEFLFKPESIVVKKALNVAIRSAEITYTDALNAEGSFQLTTLVEANVNLMKEKLMKEMKCKYKQKMESLQLPMPVSDADFDTKCDEIMEEVLKEVAAQLKNADEWKDVFDKFKSDSSTLGMRDRLFEQNKQKRYDVSKNEAINLMKIGGGGGLSCALIAKLSWGAAVAGSAFTYIGVAAFGAIGVAAAIGLQNAHLVLHLKKYDPSLSELYDQFTQPGITTQHNVEPVTQDSYAKPHKTRKTKMATSYGT
ncbi:hypothetical protein EMCRGX_G012132 [Ephydatia muelleri]